MCFTLHTAYMNVISIVNKRKNGPSFCQTAWIIYWRKHKLDKHTDEWVVTLGDRCTPQEAEDVYNKHKKMTAFSLCFAILFRLQWWWRVKTIQPLLSGWRESDKQRENIFIFGICLIPRKKWTLRTPIDDVQYFHWTHWLLYNIHRVWQQLYQHFNKSFSSTLVSLCRMSFKIQNRFSHISQGPGIGDKVTSQNTNADLGGLSTSKSQDY